MYPSTSPSPLLVFQYPTMPHTVLMSLYLVACVSPSFSFFFCSLSLFIYFSLSLFSLCLNLFFFLSFSFSLFLSLFFFLFFLSFSFSLFLFLSLSLSLFPFFSFCFCPFSSLFLFLSFSVSLFCFVPSLSASPPLSLNHCTWLVWIQGEKVLRAPPIKSAKPHFLSLSLHTRELLLFWVPTGMLIIVFLLFPQGRC